jgi:3'-5' exoribonuclease
MRRFINQFVDGDIIDDVFLLTEKQLRSNRNANLYLFVDLRDKTGVINGRMWNVTEEAAAPLNSGEFVQVKGKVQMYQGALQMIVTHIYPRPTDGLDLADFLPRSDRDLGRLNARLREILLSLEEPHLRALMECFLIDESLMQNFTNAPAGIKTHHAYQGGLLEHVVTMLEMGLRTANLYPSLDADVLLAGIFLHDIGKTRELSYENGFGYTDEGQLLGHLIIAVEMLSEKIRQTVELTGDPFPVETELRLKHLIVSHHGSYQFGSPKLPMTPEAVALHHIDNLDAKIHEFTRDIQDDPNPQSRWTPFNARLDRKLFKGTPKNANS